jgi:hypothetical protein
MTVTITITSPGADTGPFDLYHNLNGFSTAFETSVPKSSLTSGYLSNLVPDGATIIRVQSTGTCTNYIDLAISGVPATTTTTTTTTTTAAPVIIPVEWNLSNATGSTVTSRELKFYKNGSLIQLITSDGTGTINYALNDTIRVTIEINLSPLGNQNLSIYDQSFNTVFVDSSGSNSLLDSGNILLDSLSGITDLYVYGDY